MTASQLIDLRLRNLLIAPHPLKDPKAVVSHLGAVQAQDYAAAKFAIALRLPGTTDRDLEQAIARKSIIRSWSFRGTLHFMAPDDIGWMLGLAGPRLRSLYAGSFRRLGLEGDLLKKSYRTLIRAMEGGHQLTRPELKEILERQGIPTHDIRLGFLLLLAASEGLICLGSRRGKAFTYTLLEEWLPGKCVLLPEVEALARLAVQYFTSHGPASFRDFVWWSGLTVALAKRALEHVRSGLSEVTWSGQPYWYGKDSEAPGKPSSGAFLLPSFDEYLVGYKDRSLVLDPEYQPLVMGAGNGLFSPIIVMKGRVAGTWKRTFWKDTVEVHFASFTPLSATGEKSIVKAAADFGRFAAMPADCHFK